MRPHRACPFGAGRGSQPAIRFPLFLKASPPKNNLFWRNRALFPVASRSNPRCSKAQIVSYLAQIRRFLAPAAWASSTSTRKPATNASVVPEGFQQVLGLFFFGDGWKRAVAVPDMLAAPSSETIQWHTHGRNWASTCLHVPGFGGQPQSQLESRGPIGKQRACPEGFLYFWKWPAKKTIYFGEIGRFFPWPLEAIHAAAKLKLRAIGPK